MPAAIKRRLKMVDLWNEGHTYKQIGNAFGVSYQAVQQQLAKAKRDGYAVLDTAVKRPSITETVTCKACGCEFEAFKREARQYCSNACARKCRIDLNSKYTVHGTCDLTCDGCGEVFQRTKHRYEQSMLPSQGGKPDKRHFCSQQCYWDNGKRT